MIIRIWKGTTAHSNSDKYEQLLKEVVFPQIKQKDIPGYHGIQLLKNSKEDGVDFVTIMAFENLEAIKKFAGENYEQSYVIDQAKVLLQDYDVVATHYELLHDSITK